MNLDLTTRQTEIVLQKLRDGSHASVSDVIDEALRLLLIESEWKRHARQMILEGVEDFRDGRRIDGARAVEDIRRKLDLRRSSEKE